MSDEIKVLKVIVVSLVIYALVASWTYGYCAARPPGHDEQQWNVREDAAFCAFFWPIYWPGHASRLFWEGGLK